MSEFRGKGPTPGELYLAEVTQRFEAGETVTFHSSPIDEIIADSGRLAMRANMDLGVQGFLNEFAQIADEQAKDLQRWSEGRGLATPTDEARELIASQTPAHVVINEEALGGIQVRPAKHFKVDLVAGDIMAEIAALLPRKIDAYRYKQGYADEVIEVPGLGKVEVRLYDSDDIFKSISRVKIGDFRIWNARQTGLWYNNNLINNSNPHEIKIGATHTKLEMYDDTSGIYVKKDGKRFTNARVWTRFGSGYDNDWQRDTLYRTKNDGLSEQGDAPNFGWQEDKTELSWAEVQDEAIVWMAENILFPLREAPKPAEQATKPPEAQPFPHEKVGPLFTLIEMKHLRRVELIKDDPSKANPDERYAIRPNWRLVPLGNGGRDTPAEAHDAYIYAKPGEITADTDLTQINRIGKEFRNTDRLLGTNHGFAQIKPKTADSIYVVDWGEWEASRERAFARGERRLTDMQVDQNYDALSKTMVPVTEYDGSYREPIVVIGRDLALDEIEALYPAPAEER